ncbi:MAG TPA: hypothetical protein VII54_03275 [Gaiellaceae bacterium]
MIRPVTATSARRALVAVAAVAAAGALAAPAAHADGDPASDSLLLQNVYFPNRAPSQAVAAALEQAIDAVYAHAGRVKVALVYSIDDLGAIPSLFGKPEDYAHFLGIELSLWYVGPLLVVMPSGFGVYDGGRSTAAEEQVLRGVPLAASTPDDLTRTATVAIQRLTAANALSSPDIRAPLVTAYPATAIRGRTAILHFAVFDDSGYSKAVVHVDEGGSPLATLSTPMAFKIGTRAVAVHWPVPKKLHSRQLRFCVVASDPAGNRSKPMCAPFLRVS